MQEEKWLPIKSYENYSISSIGRVKNEKTGNILKPTKNLRGYLVYKFQSTSNLAHRLVAIAFLEPPDKNQTVDHIDRNKENNVVSNLRWASSKEQTANRKKRKSTNQYGRAVWKCGLESGEKIELFPNMTFAGKSMGGNGKSAGSQICLVAKKRRNSAFGFKWVYQDEETIEGEKWEPLDPSMVKGQEGYSISSEGRIQNRLGHMNNPFQHGGYLYHSVQPYTFSAHRLVALTFLENIDNKPFVNHINGNKLDCRLVNLEFVTHQENIQHAVDNGLLCNGIGIKQYTLDAKFVKEYPSASSAAKELGLNGNVILQSIKPGGTCGGFQFRMTKGNTIHVHPIGDRTYSYRISKFSPSNDFIEGFANARGSARSLNIDMPIPNLAAGIKRACATGNLYKNFYWKFSEDKGYYCISKFSPSKDFIKEFANTRGSAISLNIDMPILSLECGIKRACKSGKKYKNFYWEFSDGKNLNRE